VNFGAGGGGSFAAGDKNYFPRRRGEKWRKVNFFVAIFLPLRHIEATQAGRPVKLSSEFPCRGVRV